ncbi:class II fructose-1,6-bisphosphate aldolase [Candidatus Woesearchaeota archaeon]|nr:class II fructose-1,6-bisphosphate aldolase [Candidatus Woesearchaeota archaeon]
MTLVTGSALLKNALHGRYAVGAFNVNNLEILQAIVQAAEKQKSPAILQTSEGAIAYAGLNNLVLLIKEAAKQSKMPFALHLDHGRDLKLVKKCIDAGYTSIMYDGSHLPFAQNIANTKKVVGWAHRKGISVEAELGTIGGAEDKVSARSIFYTEPDSAAEFVKRTKCDSLAIAIGTSHGAYKFAGTPRLDIGRLKVIRELITIPLVLHGASGVPSWLVDKARQYGACLGDPEGVPDDQITRAIQHGICKVNTDTDLRLAFDAGVREFLALKCADFDPRDILGHARDLMQQVVEHRMQLFGSSKKA